MSIKNNNKLNEISTFEENYNIATIGKYGENVIKNFLDETVEKYGTIKEMINIISKDEIESSLNNDKHEYLFVVGDAEEKGTKEIIDKIISKKEKTIFLILKNYKNIYITDNNNINVVDIQREKDIYDSLQALLYQIFYPSIETSDYKDLWDIFDNDKYNVIDINSIEVNIKNLNSLREELIKKKDVKEIGIEICAGIEIELSDINRIVDCFQNNGFRNKSILLHITFEKNDNNKIVKIIFINSKIEK